MEHRVAFLIRKTLKNGKVNIKLIQYNFGMGRAMHDKFIKDLMEIKSNATEKTINNFMMPTNDNNSLCLEEIYESNSANIPNIFNINTIKSYFSKIDNDNGGMIIDLKENTASNNLQSLEIEELKIAFVLGFEECSYKSNIHKSNEEEPFENLYTGEEYVKISCKGEFACPKFIKHWNSFVEHHAIKEVI